MTAPQDMTDNRIIETHEDAVRRLFAFMKDTDRYDDLVAKGIDIDGGGMLLPVARLHSNDPATIRTLAAWRAANQDAFPTRFNVTEEGTATWLKKGVLGNPGRMLFLVVDGAGRPVGHMGFANCLEGDGRMEIDNVVRGESDGSAGIMSRAMTALLTWVEEMFLPTGIFLRVFEDNARAIRFYERLGFREDVRLPLRRHEENGVIHFEDVAPDDDSPPDAQFCLMIRAADREWDGKEMILTAGPSIGSRESSYALDAAKRGWNANWSGYLDRFQNAFAEIIGVKHCLATSSCTGALHIALAALGIGPGDEVIVPELTWVATANAVLYVGATPVFADVEPDSWGIDPERLAEYITERTKAVIPVHLYGHPARVDRVVEIAREAGLFVIEDAAPAIGAEVEGQRVGTFGDFACFSFQGAKLLVTGEGGTLVTNDDELFAKAYKIWDQGRIPGTFWIDEMGLKYKMSNVQAAIGLGQIERLDEQVEKKRRIFRWYTEGLAGCPHITLNRECGWARSICWMTSLVLDESAPVSPAELMAALKTRKIDTRPVFPAISQYPHWPRAQTPGPVSARIGARGINLPGGVRLAREKIDYVCRAIREVLS